ncbi:MAG: FkbM family methyltransferase, partial [Vicinamibacterales bacterium]
GARAEHAGTTEVTVVRGDDLVQARPEIAPTVMKLDVEGAEHLVLAGLSRVLRSRTVRAIVFEDTCTPTGEPASSAVVALLREAGYRICPLARSDEHADNGMNNFLAVPEAGH